MGDIGHQGIENCNGNGFLLLRMCAEYKLAITNTMFRQAEKYKTTWMHPRSKHWHLIDYIITRQCDLRDFTITRVMRGGGQIAGPTIVLCVQKLNFTFSR